MKKEDIVIELTDEVMFELSKLCFDYELDLAHLPFKTFKVKKVYKDVDKYFDENYNSNVLKKCRELAEENGSMSDASFNRIINNIKKSILSGVLTSVEIIDKTFYIQSEVGDVRLTFKDYVLPANWMYTDSYSVHYSNENTEVKEYLNNNDDGLEAILRSVLEVVGVLIYLQMPNKTREVQKRTNLQIEGKSNKKKSSSKKKVYLYKTTYYIDGIDIECETKDTRNYNRKTDQWISRGHWRTLRNGRKIWIKESVKKSKVPVVKTENSNTSKEYKITKVDL